MKRKSVKIFIGLVVVALIAIIIMVCPFFNIKQKIIVGNNVVTNDTILKTIEVTDQTVNLYAFNSLKAESNLLKNPYIQSVDFSRHFPDTLEIDITERKVCGYVPYMGNYLYIDNNGRVLDIQSSYTQPLPVVIGLDFTEFTLGEILKVNNNDAFEIVVELAKLISKYELLNDIIKVDVSKTSDIHIYVNKIDVLFGNFTDYNWKMSALNEILKNLSPDDKGILDISSSNSNPIFTYLT